MNTAPPGNNNAANHIPAPVRAEALIQQKFRFLAETEFFMRFKS